MSELILKWLNEEIGLSRKVSSFEEDFANGFLFGELLARYNQQLNFGQFVDSGERTHRLMNYELLFPTLQTLGITFNHNVANQLMRAAPETAQHILYQLKTSLEKVSGILPKGGKTATLAPLKKLPQNKPEYDRAKF
jgi:hypothetical protein